MKRNQRRAANRMVELLESLEQRRLLVVPSTDFNDTDADIFRVTISGPGSVVLVADASPSGRSLSITGTTMLSSIGIAVVGGTGNGEVSINSLVINGDVGSVTFQNTANLVSDSAQATFAGLRITGRAKTITINGSVINSDISILGPGQDNRTTILLNDVTGGVAEGLARGPGVDRVVVSSAGVIQKFDANFVDLLTVQARWMTEVFIHNNNPGRGEVVPGSDIDLIATDTGVPWGIKTVVIDGTVSFGDWDINSPVQSILIGSVGFTPAIPNRGVEGELNIDVDGRIGTLRATNGDLFGRFTAQSFGVLTAADEMQAFVSRTGAPNSEQPGTASIDTLRAATFLNCDIVVLGGIKQLNAGSIALSDFDLGWLGVGTITGGGLNTVDFTLRADTATRSRALDQLTVAGSTSGTTIFSQLNNLGALAFNGGLIGSSILAGTVGSPSFFTDPSPFALNRTIQSIKIKAPIGDPPAFGGPTVIVAQTIGSFTSTARHATNAGNDFGIVADVLSSVSVRRGNNALFTSSNTSFDDPDSDFRIRIL